MEQIRVLGYKYIIGIVAVVASLVLTACGGKGDRLQGDIPYKLERTRGDSIALAARFSGNFEYFLAVTDSLAEAGELSPIRADGYRGVAYFQLGQTDKCVEVLRRVVAIDNPPAEDFWEYIHAGTNLVIMLTTNRDYDNAMRTALRLIDKLKDVDSPQRATEMQTLYLCLGDTQMMLERLDDARKSYDEAYQWVLRTPNDSTCRPIAASIETLENISFSLLNHHLDEAGVWVDRMDSLVTLYEKEPKVIEKEVKTLRALVFLHRARFLQMRGQSKEAAYNYDQYARSDYGQGLEGRINGCDYLMAANRYGEAADIYTNLDQFIKEWGYDYDLETIRQNLLPKFRANYLSGRQDSALRVAMQIAEVYDTALVRQKRSESAELATIYDTQGKERKILEQRAENRLVTAISIAIAILALLILAFAVYIFHQWRNTKKKNRIFVDQINEVLEYKKKYRELKQKTQAQQTHPQPLPVMEGSGSLSISDMTELTDEQLFLCLRDLIENEKLFLKPDFGRQTLIEHTGLSKERIGAAFAQGSDSVSLPAYVRELRLDYAVRLMNDQPDIAVEVVSQSSGFTNADTFTRNFRAKYGMTPTTYKQTLNSDK
ncbi:helix-turn-helix domain-containing protein [Prevotella communis]|uniref:helix-turn-helix domain-containing protein n=1 Tax=Prevotella communis TaxID=2913614 RepID=UPI001EDA34D9|nr:helix-turn-helix domain-containing protein [Prevotella communis]UKK67734.1 helix-turn-helix domain-containing protein [Prevotella communis]UKK70119.1 helix-turn-helix domain-containing protein [Prevotella communis]